MNRFMHAYNYAFLSSLPCTVAFQEVFGMSAYWGIFPGVLIGLGRYFHPAPVPEYDEE